MNYIAQCLEKFRELPVDFRETVGGVDSLAVVRNLEKKYGANLSFVVVLVAIGELSLKTLPGYFSEKYGFSEEDADDLVEELIDGIFSHLSQNKKALSKDELGDILKGNFLELFDDQERVKLVDRSIFILLSQDGAAITYFGKCLLENGTELVKGKLILENKPADSTIANWLKDFIKEKGSDMFNELALAEYLAISPNPKNLSPENKNLLRRILKLYRNLAFFPESQENLPTEEWEIIPSDNGNTASSKIQDKFIQRTENAARHELEISLHSFQKGSLEYRAASEELERLNKVINKA